MYNVSEFAGQERNWGLYKVVDGRKLPWLDCAVPAEQAFAFTLDEVLEQVDEHVFWLGYLPREGSALIGVDLDHCLDEVGLLPDFVDLVGSWEGFEGNTPSGEGLRLLLERTPDWPTYTRERNDVGYYGSASRGMTVPLDCLTAIECTGDQELVERVLARLDYREHNGQSTSEQQEAWDSHWLSQLSANELSACVHDIIGNYKDVADREAWLSFTFACKNMELHTGLDLFEAWDAHCQKFNSYDASENAQIWNNTTALREGGVTFAMLVNNSRFDQSRWYNRLGGDNILADRIRASEGHAERVRQVEAVNHVEPTFEERVAAFNERYVLDMVSNNVYDLDMDNALVKTGALKHKWSARPYVIVDAEGVETITNPVDLWLRSELKQETYVAPQMNPRSTERFADGVINTYKPFVPADDVDPASWDMFQDLVCHVFPEDHDYALNWIAKKVQEPWHRGVALVNYTPTQGTGRNSIMAILRKLLGEANCTNPSAAAVFGDKADKFNGYMGKLLVTIAEVDEGNGDVRAMRSVYNRLKGMVDPNERVARLELKGKEAVDVEVFTSFMIATNCAAGLPIEAGDRRFSVCRGNDTPLPRDIIQWLSQLDTRGLTAIYNQLLARDVSLFDMDTPATTAAKDAMIRDAKGVVDLAMEEYTEDNPVFTVNLAVSHLRILPECHGINEHSLTMQVRGWSNKNSYSPEWTDKQGRVKYKGIAHKLRILNGVMMDKASTLAKLDLQLYGDQKRLTPVNSDDEN